MLLDEECDTKTSDTTGTRQRMETSWSSPSRFTPTELAKYGPGDEIRMDGYQNIAKSEEDENHEEMSTSSDDQPDDAESNDYDSDSDRMVDMEERPMFRDQITPLVSHQPLRHGAKLRQSQSHYDQIAFNHPQMPFPRHSASFVASSSDSSTPAQLSFSRLTLGELRRKLSGLDNYTPTSHVQRSSSAVLPMRRDTSCGWKRHDSVPEAAYPLTAASMSSSKMLTDRRATVPYLPMETSFPMAAGGARQEAPCKSQSRYRGGQLC